MYGSMPNCEAAYFSWHGLHINNNRLKTLYTLCVSICMMHIIPPHPVASHDTIKGFAPSAPFQYVGAIRHVFSTSDLPLTLAIARHTSPSSPSKHAVPFPQAILGCLLAWSTETASAAGRFGLACHQNQTKPELQQRIYSKTIDDY